MHIFVAFVAFLESSKYILILLGSFFEGSAVMMATGLLWHTGVVNFWFAYVMLLAGDILSDTIWYFVGYFGGRPFFSRWGHLMGVTSDVFAKVERRFKKYHMRILVISKLTMGLGLATVILSVAGMMKVAFVRYFFINLIGGFIWILFLMLVGYFFGNVLVYVPKDFKIAIAVAIPILFLFAMRALTKKLATLDW